MQTRDRGPLNRALGLPLQLVARQNRITIVADFALEADGASDLRNLERQAFCIHLVARSCDPIDEPHVLGMLTESDVGGDIEQCRFGTSGIAISVIAFGDRAANPQPGSCACQGRSRPRLDRRTPSATIRPMQRRP